MNGDTSSSNLGGGGEPAGTLALRSPDHRGSARDVEDDARESIPQTLAFALQRV